MSLSDARPVFRFAPSPNGYLHLGHAYSALVNQKLARQAGGRLLLRIEDIDTGRCRPEYEEAIYEDLAWLGIAWETPVRRQSEHFSEYARALESIWERNLVYPCFCSRTDITQMIGGAAGWPADPDGAPLYPGRCKHLAPEETRRWLASGRSATLRLHCDEAIAEAELRLGWREYYEGGEARDVAAEPSRWGDAVVGRRDAQLTEVAGQPGQVVVDPEQPTPVHRDHLVHPVTEQEAPVHDRDLRLPQGQEFAIQVAQGVRQVVAHRGLRDRQARQIT